MHDLQGIHWILLAFGYGIFGIGFVMCSAISLAYCTDCYQDVCLPPHPLIPLPSLTLTKL